MENITIYLTIFHNFFLYFLIKKITNLYMFTILYCMATDEWEMSYLNQGYHIM